MIEKFYEMRCDYCGCVINHYPRKSPTEQQQSPYRYGTKTKHFCSDTCWGEWNHDRQERQYMNLKQKGKIHTNE